MSSIRTSSDRLIEPALVCLVPLAGGAGQGRLPPRAIPLPISLVASLAPLARLALRGLTAVSRETREDPSKLEKGRRGASGKTMEAREIEGLKGRVECSAVLEKAGFAIDIRESTRRAIKFRRGDDIIIVIHGEDVKEFFGYFPEGFFLLIVGFFPTVGQELFDIFFFG